MLYLYSIWLENLFLYVTTSFRLSEEKGFRSQAAGARLSPPAWWEGHGRAGEHGTQFPPVRLSSRKAPSYCWIEQKLFLTLLLWIKQGNQGYQGGCCCSHRAVDDVWPDVTATPFTGNRVQATKHVIHMPQNPQLCAKGLENRLEALPAGPSCLC